MNHSWWEGSLVVLTCCSSLWGKQGDLKLTSSLGWLSMLEGNRDENTFMEVKSDVICISLQNVWHSLRRKWGGGAALSFGWTSSRINNKIVLASECSPIDWHLRWVRRALEKRRVIKSDAGSLNPAVQSLKSDLERGPCKSVWLLKPLGRPSQLVGFFFFNF